MQLLKQNEKMKRSSGPKTFNFGISAFQTSDGFRTCPNAGACAKGCYARQGRFHMPNVKNAYESRTAITRMESFVDLVQLEIDSKNPERIRIHDSGDFYSFDYLHRWMMIAEKNPDVRFYAYTKMISLTKKYDAKWEIPPNVTLIYSFGGKEDDLIDVAKDRHSRVFASRDELLAAGYADASVDDSVALGKKKKIGLIYHGANARRFLA
jgi:hypothetical protein